jgi:transcriptional regulator with XRE-family HTH domain
MDTAQPREEKKMTVPEHNPVVQQRRLRAELRKARDQAELTQAQVAEEMDWSVSKVIRIETGAVGLSITDLRALLQLYGVVDRAVVNELVEVGKASRRRAWWDSYRDLVGDVVARFIGLESSASLVRQYDSGVLPGLLQTPGYARATLSPFNTDQSVIDKKVEFRAKRQEILKPEYRVKFHFVLEETVLRRVVGGPVVMKEQLELLRKLRHQSNISIKMIPFSAGVHVGVGLGSFVVLEFPGDEQDHVAAVEHSGVGLGLQDDPEQVSKYVEAFVQLEDLAGSPNELDSLIDTLIRDL